MKIGVFDSGKGGLAVAIAIEEKFIKDEIVFKDDHMHLPYGSKPPELLLSYVAPILKELVSQGCQVIVIACNTVTTTLISDLRKIIDVPLVGIEPMIKPASLLTHSGIIAVCATPTTLFSKRYKYLKDTYAKEITVLEPDCSDWTYMIENNKINIAKISKSIDDVCLKGADVVVLGCTHYHWIEDQIKLIVKGRAKVIQPEQAIISQLKRVIEQLA